MRKNVKCKSCGRDIERGYKCLECGKDNKNFFMKHKVLTFILVVFIIVGIVESSDSVDDNNSTKINSSTNIITAEKKDGQEEENNIEESSNKDEVNESLSIKSTEENKNDIFEGYKLIEVDGGDLSGHREPNVVVDIGFGDREYYAFTNEYGQLVKVMAKEIIIQDDTTEPVNSNGRYYKDEAKVPGVESASLDEGHVIADSLGGVSNAYNITPQNSNLNRHGDQAYMEKVIRDAGGCTDFLAIISYPDTTTQIPSHYSYTYTINGTVINDEFDNINPDEYNASLESNTTSNNSSVSSNVESSTSSSTTNESNTANSEIVYWTPNGNSYHTRRNCSTLSRSKTILEGTIGQSGKSDPCNVCH